jgi:ribosomal protein L17
MKATTKVPDKQDENRNRKPAARRTPPVATQWKPGQSGNPAGRPKSLTLSEAYRRELAKIDETDPQKRTFAEVLAEQMIVKAKTGDVAALREVADRVEGKAKQTITLSTDRREQVERAIDRMISTAASDGHILTREDATAALAAYAPEVSQLLH